jgi:hypothetical protein
MRTWIANKLVRLARKIDPPNKEAMQFFIDRMTDMIITGQSTIKVTAVDPYEEHTISLRT